jgi:hypothetical protein
MKQIAFRHESFSEELTQSDTLYSVNVALPTSLGAGKQCPDIAVIMLILKPNSRFTCEIWQWHASCFVLSTTIDIRHRSPVGKNEIRIT